jgi:YesN/AraC family two-component response regulator
MSPSFGRGSIYQGMENIGNSYKEAVKALKYRIIEGEGAVIQYNTINNMITESYYYPITAELNLINYVKEGDFDKVNELLEKIINENIYARNLDSDTAKYVSNEIISTAIKIIDQLNLTGFELIEYEYLDSLETIFETYEYIKEIYKKICIIIKEKYDTDKKELDAAIIEFVENNCFERHLSLDLISNKYQVSNSYISSLFREKLGITYLEYVNKKRIQNAISQMNLPNTSLADICLKVGYDNARTFRRNFKKYTGYNPSEYIVDGKV